MAKFSGQANEPKKKGILHKLRWFDPFYYVDLFVMPKVKERTDSSLVENIVNFLFAIIFAALIYVILGFAFGSSTPLVIVYSESMEDTFYRGDVMGLANLSVSGQEVTLNRNLKNTPAVLYLTPVYSNGTLQALEFENNQTININENGSIIVYNSYPHNIPIIHRTIAKINANDGTFLITKGDNDKTNPTFDQDCGTIILNNPDRGCVTFYAINVNDLQGVSFFQAPLVGCVKLWLFDDLFSLITTGKLPRDFKGIC